MIGTNIRRLRQERNLSQQALASELKITQGAVSQWEKGATSPDTNQLIALSEFFRVSIEDLLYEDSLVIRTKMKKVQDDFSETEMKLILDFRSLSDEGQERVLDYMSAMCFIYKKPSIPSRMEKQNGTA